jgi:hypothetical protein
MDFLLSVLEAERARNTRRIEIPCINLAGRTVFKTLKLLGFQKEGTLREKESYFDRELGRKRYLDVEMWSKLLQGGA